MKNIKNMFSIVMLTAALTLTMGISTTADAAVKCYNGNCVHGYYGRHHHFYPYKNHRYYRHHHYHNRWN